MIAKGLGGGQGSRQGPGACVYQADDVIRRRREWLSRGYSTPCEHVINSPKMSDNVVPRGWTLCYAADHPEWKCLSGARLRRCCCRCRCAEVPLGPRRCKCRLYLTLWMERKGLSKVRYLRGWMGVMVLAVDVVVVVVLTLGGWKMVIGWDAIKTVGQNRRFQRKPLLSKRTSSTSTVHQKARPPTVSHLSSL